MKENKKGAKVAKQDEKKTQDKTGKTSERLQKLTTKGNA